MDKVTFEDFCGNPSLGVLHHDNFYSNVFQLAVIGRHIAYNIYSIHNADSVDIDSVNATIEDLISAKSDIDIIIDELDKYIASKSSENEQ